MLYHMHSQYPILKTKLFPPPVPDDYVLRDDVYKKLTKGLDRPLILVSAPAGYGKSTLVSHWSQTIKARHCWLSLGVEDNQLNTLLTYLIATIRGHFPTFGEDLLQLLKSPEPLPPKVVINSFVNAISNLDQEILLVLDDYHLITDLPSHDLIETLLTYPSPHLHLVLICRSDPALPIATYRIKGKIQEIRVNDLLFSQEDIGLFFERKFDQKLNHQAVSRIEAMSEGWISGLKLLSFSLDSNLSDIKSSEENLQKLVLGDLVKGMLVRLEPETKQFLLFTCILPRFNEALCNHLCSFNTAPVIDRLKTSNLFIIPLDDQLNWYRYHHLFAELLQNELSMTLESEEINELHSRAADWFQEQREEILAVRHYLEAGLSSKAIEIFTPLRTVLINDRHWNELEFLFKQFPEKAATQNIVLQLTQCWLNIYHGRIKELFDKINSVEQMVSNCGSENLDLPLLGEYYCLLAYKIYRVDQDYERCLTLTEKALQYLPQDHHYARGYAWIFWGGTMQTMEKTEEAERSLYQAIDQGNVLNAPNALLLILNFLFWFEGDAQKMFKCADKLLSFGLRVGNKEAIANGNIFLGAFFYITGDFQKAIGYFEKAELLRSHTVGIMSFFGDVAHAYCLAFTKRTDELSKHILKVDRVVHRQGGEMLRSFWGAFTAELQLLSGEQLAAFNWVESAPSYPLMPITNVSDPNLALLRINLAQNTTSSLQRADKMISELEPILSKTNNGHFLYGIHIAKALLLFLQSEEEQSILVLNRANQRFGPGGMLTVIVEFGPAVIPLLEQYLQTYPEDSMSSDVLGLLKPGHSPVDKYKLTNREIVIIKLLSQNLTNKEIASRLFISEKTVKRHSSNLYKKLQVTNRREAARQAEAMELL